MVAAQLRAAADGRGDGAALRGHRIAGFYTDLAEGKGSDLHRIPDPADPRRQLTLVSALRPDLTLVHGACADEAGNVVLFPPLGEGQYAAYAARRGVLASVERIVSSEEMASLADRVIVPGQRVLGLCEAPMGAHPQSLRAAEAPGVSGYLEDYEFIEDIVDRCAAEERGRDWYREWVLDVGSHDGYLDKLGSARRTALRWDGSALPSAATDLREPASTQERVIVLGARAVADRVRSGGYDTLLAGIGASHMAAWLAAELLRREGCPVKIASELGAYGFTPEPGDVFLFSLRHAERAEGLGGIAEILGGMVSANPRALGVLGAAEIDRYGTINTSRSASGRWLTGSGGANDIASSTDCVVVAQASPRRFVPKVSYRTSPGDRVVEVASQFGRFTRSESTGEFRLTNVLTSEPALQPDRAGESRRRTRRPEHRLGRRRPAAGRNGGGGTDHRRGTRLTAHARPRWPLPLTRTCLRRKRSCTHTRPRLGPAQD